MPDTNLDEAISKAAEEITGEKVPEVILPKDEITEGDESEESNEESEEDSELSDTEKDESLRLYRALKDPKTAGPVIAALAQQAGLSVAKEGPPTKTEEKKVAKDIKAILAEGLGEYKFLADRLGPAIEAILLQERESNEQKFSEITQSRIENEVVAVTNNLAKETKGESKKLEIQMAKLAEEIPIGSQSVETYIRRLYTIASGEKAKSSPKAIADKIRRNANDPTSRLHASRGDLDPHTVPKGKLNINQSVNWALEQIAAGLEKK